ncbi:MAG: type IV secretion system DNA-binding domain-containing protein [Thermofilaceae archaeon]
MEAIERGYDWLRGRLQDPGEAKGDLKSLLQWQQQLRQTVEMLNHWEEQKAEMERYRTPAACRLYLPDSQRGTMVCGAPGSGKTFSIIDPLLRSAVELGYPIVLYDFKYPDQAAALAPYAAMLGYEVYIFAPGYPESETVNVLDFLRDCLDAETAGQIAAVMNKNFSLGATKEEDPFFHNAANQLIQAAFMLCKAAPEADLITCQALMALPELVERLEEWRERDEQQDKSRLERVNPDWGRYAIPRYNKDWIMAAFSQIISVGKSEKTLASIIGVANNNLVRFMKPNIAPHFVGKSSFDFWLEGRKLLILGLDRVRRESISPLVATVLHLIVSYNLTDRKRRDPLIVALDELPTLYLPQLQNWLNENRSDGFCGIIGFQNINQLEKTYGKELSRAIITGCNTKCIFNPGEPDSAEFFSKMLGEEELLYKSKSRSTGKGGGSVSLSDQERTRKLFDPAEFLKMPSGTCVLISPGFSAKRQGKEESNVPILRRIRIHKREIELVKKMSESWSEFLIYYCRQRGRLVPPHLKEKVLQKWQAELKVIRQHRDWLSKLVDPTNWEPQPLLLSLARRFIHLDAQDFVDAIKPHVPPQIAANLDKLVPHLPQRQRIVTLDLSSRLTFLENLLPPPAKGNYRHL